MKLASYISTEALLRINPTPTHKINKEEDIQNKDIVKIKLYCAPDKTSPETYEFNMGYFGYGSSE